VLSEHERSEHGLRERMDRGISEVEGEQLLVPVHRLSVVEVVADRACAHDAHVERLVGTDADVDGAEVHLVVAESLTERAGGLVRAVDARDEEGDR
jgi:hypothetical protein